MGFHIVCCWGGRCAPAPLVHNAVATLNQTSRSVTISCMMGYRFPDGLRVKTFYCHQDGTWDYYIPRCDGMYWPRLWIIPQVRACSLAEPLRVLSATAELLVYPLYIYFIRCHYNNAVGVPGCKKSVDDILSYFGAIPDCDRQTEGQSDRQKCYNNILLYLVSDNDMW